MWAVSSPVKIEHVCWMLRDLVMLGRSRVVIMVDCEASVVVWWVLIIFWLVWVVSYGWNGRVGS